MGGTMGTSTSPHVETSGNHRLIQEHPDGGRTEPSPRQEKGESDPQELTPRRAVLPTNGFENYQLSLSTPEVGGRNGHKEENETTTLYETSIIKAHLPLRLKKVIANF